MDEYVKVIRRQTEILLRNIQVTLDTITETQLNATIVKWPIWKHFYHLLHSLDQWFINPFNYTQPSFHRDGMNYFDKLENHSPSRKQLLEYFHTIKRKIDDYLSELTDISLCDCPDRCNFSRLDLIIGQNRHLMYNLGMIHIMLQIESGKLPEYVGMSQPRSS